jgi:anti-sigma factor RsiW
MQTMRCSDLSSLIEPIAAGDIAPGADVSAHLNACPVCAADLALARRLNGILEAREAPMAPPRFTPAVMRRVRHERWRAEQYLDVGFNVAILVSIALVIGGIWLALNLTGLVAVTSGTVQILSGGLEELIQRAAPRLAVYAGAFMLVLSALAVWWWAERGWSV